MPAARPDMPAPMMIVSYIQVAFTGRGSFLRESPSQGTLSAADWLGALEWGEVGKRHPRRAFASLLAARLN